ncbi:hypothetical protein KGM_201440 [Danaus plexippus plexippus]|uniref:Uncharacterized protein n=1 Tax=Danaus plexippus plexippus TaxID=278856 RepID=A0A212ES75_DANPL|nr:hypothetical protein KGM_201440 [Danaus plexippus plexippus]
MTRSLSVLLLTLGFIGASYGVTSKLDFGEEEASVVMNSSKEDDDVEVKHTIVVSTKLRNNNRKGIHNNDDSSSFLHSLGTSSSRKDDSGEVPVVAAYKSVETTKIRTPDTRFKTTVYPDFVPIRRNSRDEYDRYPNLDLNQFKPSSFYNNINWWNQDSNIHRHRPDYTKTNRGYGDDGVREFYCRKCRELNGPRGCIPRGNSWIVESTTPRIKIDGKIAKLN